MKAFEAQNFTNQSHYEKVMKKIEDAIKRGWKTVLFDRYNSSYSFLKFPQEVIEKLLEDGFDLKLNYNIYDQLESVKIFWENSKEGKRGTLTITKEDKTPAPKPSLWRRICDFFEPEGDY